MIDDFEAIACGVRDEHAPGLRIESTMIELRVARVRNCDAGYLFERHRLTASGRDVIVSLMYLPNRDRHLRRPQDGRFADRQEAFRRFRSSTRQLRYIGLREIS